MGITKYGVWVFFESKEVAKKVSKELNTLMNRYGICIMNKLKVLEGNSLKFFLSNKQAVYEVTWKFNNIKYVFIDVGEGWELDTSSEGMWDEGEKKLKEITP